MKNQKQNILKNTVMVFRKWGRKNYSVFSTLKKVVNVSVLSVTYLLSVPVPAMAIERDTSEVKINYDLDEVEVTASRIPLLYSQVARVLSVIEAREIKNMPAESIQDLLEYVAGIDIRQRGAEGVQADISIRGGTFDQTLILLNGINITDPQTGHHNLNLPISLSQIERIEILEGPAARVYGPNAFSGAINIVTQQPEQKSIRTQVSTGSFGYFNTGLTGSFRTGQLKHMLAASRNGSKGYIENTDFSSSNFYYSGEHISGAGNLFFQGGLTRKAFGANSFYTPVYPNQFEKIQALFGSVRMKLQTKLNLTPSVYWRRHYDTFMLFRENAPGWYSHHNYHRTDVWGADLNSWFLWIGGKTSVGAGFRSEAILSNVLGEPLAEIINFRKKEVFYSHSKNRKITSLFAEHAVYQDKWSLNTGIMANYISDNELGINLFPGIDLSYNVISPLKLLASWNTSLRMPTFTDLYYAGPTNIGNMDLKPEKTSALEGGMKLSSKILQGHVILYHRTGTHLIDWIKTGEDQLWKAMNHTEISSQGIELNFLLLPGIQFNKNFTDRIEVGYMFNRQQKEDSPFISYYVLDNLKHKFVASVTRYVTEKFSLNARAIYQDREGTFNYYDGSSYQEEVDYKSFWIFDVKAAYHLKDLAVFVSANNLFDLQYYDIGNIVQPGRWIKAGISYTYITGQ